MNTAEYLTQLIDCKADMKAAIESKGVTVSGGLSTYADAIRDIKGNTINCELDFSKLNYTSNTIANTMINLQDSIDYGVWLVSNKNNLIREEPVYYHDELGGGRQCGSFLQANPKLIFFPSAKISDLYVRNNYSGNYIGVPSKMFFGSENLRTVGRITLDCEDNAKNTYLYSMFAYCKNLSEIELFDTSKVTSMDSMFFYCSGLKSIPQFDTSNVTNMFCMFYGCNKLTSIPQLNTSKVTSMNGMFSGCAALQSIPQLDTSNVTSMNGMFSGCTALKKIPKFDCSNVREGLGFMDGCNAELEGFPNLGKVENISISTMFINSNLSRQSCINVFNNLYDRDAAGYADAQLSFDPSVIDKLSSSDIAIATKKGYIINRR